ncbi:hypothetical protein Pcinc_035681 [Petrolisthes cinctipes]|uniref:Uncharacterized protein n=1 Tax=Petrolisthes cinctipes TaxID=88211 RepID=A0AAE1BZD1_PETCI|nr:hypothetical protein Pcinc_035681 [Petrolisthes cinctipes]
MSITHTTGLHYPHTNVHHSHHRAPLPSHQCPSLTPQGSITLTPMSITHTTGLHHPHTNVHHSRHRVPSPSHQCPSLTPQGSITLTPMSITHTTTSMFITHTTGLHHPSNAHHKANAHHSPLGPSTILMSNHAHSWAPSPHHRLQCSSPSTQQSPTTTVLEQTAMPMPIATSLGPITTPCFITIHTTTATNIHTGPITIHTYNITSVHSHFTN